MLIIAKILGMSTIIMTCVAFLFNDCLADKPKEILMDFYCGCPFTTVKKGRATVFEVDIESCGFESKTGEKPSIEKEHIVPVSLFAKDRECWNKPICIDNKGKYYRGRKCCLKTDKHFKKMYYDKNNIKLVIGEINRARSNYLFGQSKSAENYGRCYLTIDVVNKVAVPSEQIRNDINDIYEYMKNTYNLKIDVPF